MKGRVKRPHFKKLAFIFVIALVLSALASVIRLPSSSKGYPDEPIQTGIERKSPETLAASTPQSNETVNTKSSLSDGAGKPSIKFEDSKDAPSLQRAIDALLPAGSTINEIDAALLGQGNVFRTDNLISGFQGEEFQRGTSSAENYIFYFKPVKLAGKNGWENASAGWVIKVVYSGGGGLNLSSDKKHLVEAGQRGLVKAEVLTVPQEENGSINKHVELAKELLQYKLDLTPTPSFDESQWRELVKIHQESPCRKNLNYDCLMNQTLSLLGFPKVEIAYLSLLAERLFENADRHNAKKLLKVWPSAEAIRIEQENLPRLRRPTSIAVDAMVLAYQAQYLRLLFLAGRYPEGEALLNSMQAENKTGSDYKVITTLLKTKDFNEAYKIAKITLTWPREVPDPLEGSSAIMHCQNYRDTRPEAMGGLAHAFIGNGALDKGYEIATLIRTYWENKSFGQKSFCYSEAAKGSYLTTMSDLIKGYAAKGEKQKARQMYVEAKSVLQVQTDTIHRYSKSDFEALARTAAANGLSDGFDDLAKFVSVHSEVDYPAIYASYNSDPVPLIYAQAGEYQKAIDLIEASTYANTKPMTKMEEIVGRDSASTEDVRLTTYLSIAKSLATKGDNKGAMLFLDKATPYLGKRKPKYDPAVENLTDYITKANILLDIGEREKSKDVLGELLGLFNATNKNDYRGGSITTSFFGQFALLYARHASIDVVQAWADQLPSFYLGAYYARIAELLIEEKRWEELDKYFGEMARVLSTDREPISNWEHFTNALIKAGDFDRYLRFLNMLDKGDDASRERQRSSLRSISSGEEIKTPDTRPQIWMMNQLLVHRLIDGSVPSKIVEEVWPRYISNCKSGYYVLPETINGAAHKLDEKETMAACYLGLIESVEYQVKYPLK